MNAKLIKVSIASREGLTYTSDVKIINLRGLEGEIGISYGHTQLLTTIPSCTVYIVDSLDKKEVFHVSKGILEVQPSRVIILSDNFMYARDLILYDIKKAKDQSNDILNNIKNHSDIQIKEARFILTESISKLKTIDIFNRQDYTY